jgi:glycosyltransferase involved in cell wall biosynthesis
VIIPALNEERILGQTLERLNQAAEALQAAPPCPVEIIVVDNNSDDHTADTARAFGADVVLEPIRNIARARNTGARASRGDVLFFLDADTRVPDPVLSRIVEVMSDPDCVGGAVDVEHAPASVLIRWYLAAWRVLARLTGMAQGAAQFYRREAFLAQGGYDETIYMGEDVDCYWRICRAARRSGRRVCFIQDVRVIPSPRRFDRWPLWKTLIWTNPALIALLRRRKSAWRGWYEDIPR